VDWLPLLGSNTDEDPAFLLVDFGETLDAFTDGTAELHKLLAEALTIAH
jgi:hypothetical protein